MPVVVGEVMDFAVVGGSLVEFVGWCIGKTGGTRHYEPRECQCLVCVRLDSFGCYLMSLSFLLIRVK